MSNMPKVNDILPQLVSLNQSSSMCTVTFTKLNSVYTFSWFTQLYKELVGRYTSEILVFECQIHKKIISPISNPAVSFQTMGEAEEAAPPAVAAVPIKIFISGNCGNKEVTSGSDIAVQ